MPTYDCALLPCSNPVSQDDVHRVVHLPQEEAGHVDDRHAQEGPVEEAPGGRGV